jgi:hypothetical protein
MKLLTIFIPLALILSAPSFGAPLQSPSEHSLFLSKVKSLLRFSSVELSGQVVKISKVPGIRRSSVYWWQVTVKTSDREVPVRVAPVWWYPELPVREGDRVKVVGYRPPYWVIKGINQVMACKLIDETSGRTIDLSSWRRPCRRFSK